MVHTIDTSTFDLLANILVDQRPRSAQFPPAGTRLWVSSELAGAGSIIDVAKRQAEKHITFSVPGVRQERIQPVGIRMTRDAKTAFIAVGPENRVVDVDTANLHPLKSIKVGRYSWSVATRATLNYTVGGVSPGDKIQAETC